MRAEAVLAAEWTAEIGGTEPARSSETAIVRFVDRRGRTGYVALGCRVRRYVGVEAAREVMPACDQAFQVTTIH